MAAKFDNSIITGVVTVGTAIIGLAILAILVSGRAQTSNVIKAAGGTFAQSIAAAVSPVTGGNSGGGIFGSGAGDVNYY